MKKTSRVLLAVAILGTAFVATISYQIGDRAWDFSLGPVSSAARQEAYDLRSLKILARTALYIQGNYLDQEKVDPKKMLLAALEKVEWLLPEVVARPAPGENEESPAAIRVSVGKSSSIFDIGTIDTLWSMREKLKDIIGYIQDHLQSTDVELPEVEYAAINGLLSTLDPHSVLLDPDTYREMKVSTHGEFGGLGIVISIRDHELTIISPLEDTPAWRAGLKAQDRIVQIEDESTINMRLDDAVELLRGKVNSQVTIWVKRKGWSEPRKFTLTREKITIKSVTSKLLDDGIGYVKLKSFQGHSQEQIRNHLDQMRAQLGGELKGLILDLRGNPGGLLEQAIKISDLFLDSGTIVLTVGKGNTVKEEHKATWSGTEKRYPMAVLVGPGSASASEIVAGALQNNDRAVIIGDTTFGKGSVQVLYDMEDGSALKLTIAQYLTPGEVSIQGVGIQPDIQLKPVTIDKKNLHYYAEEHFGEGDLDSHLTNDAAMQRSATSKLVRYFEPTPPEEEQGDKKEPPPPEEEDKIAENDFTVHFARGLLSQSKVYQRTEMLSDSSGYIQSQHDKELEKIGSNLAKLDVDWSPGANQPGNQPQLTFTTDKPDGRVVAGEKIVLRARVKNTGSSPLYRMRGLTKSENSLLDAQEFIFGRLMPGEEREWEVPVEVGKQEESRTDSVTLELYSADGTESLKSAQVLVATEELKRPHLAYVWQIIDDKGGSGDGLVQRGEKLEMRLNIANTGPGKAQDVQATIANQSGEGLFLEQGRQKVDTIPPGGTAEVTFRFNVKRKLNEEKLKLQINLFDSVLREGLEEELEIPVQPDGPRYKPASGACTATAEGVKVRAGASETTPAIAQLRNGRSLPVIGSKDGWLRVDLGGGSHGWVDARTVRQHDARPPPKPPQALNRVFELRSAPIVQLDPSTLSNRVINGSRARIVGEVVDDQQVKDVYIYVQHRTGKLVKSRKLTYQSNENLQRSPTRLPFRLDVDLKEGMNTVVIVARDQDRLTAMKRLRLLRLPAAYAAEQPAAKPPLPAVPKGQGK